MQKSIFSAGAKPNSSKHWLKQTVYSFIIFSSITSLTNLTTMSNPNDKFSPPKTPKVNFKYQLHGKTLEDDYQWLENKDNPEVKKWSHEQNDYTLDFIKNEYKDIPGVKDEFRTFYDRDYRSAPFYVKNREFFLSKKRGDAHNTLYAVVNGVEVKLFNPTDLDQTGNTSWGGYTFTENGDKVAIGVQFKGNEINEYRIYDTQTGKVISEPMPGLSGFSFAKNEDYAYITIRTKEIIDKQEPLKTYLHKIGTPYSEDKFIIAPDDAKDVAGAFDSDEGGYSFISKGDFYSVTISMKKTGDYSNFRNNDYTTIYSSKEFAASPYIKNGRMYISTNDKAPNFKLMYVDLSDDINKMSFENWKTLIPESKDEVFESYVITSDYLVVQYKKDVLSRLALYDFNGNKIKELDLPEFGNVSGISYRKETNEVYVSLATFVAPSKLYKFNGKSLKWDFVYQEKTPIDMTGIESKMVFYQSKDGTKIPMYLIYKKDVKLDGNNPTLLYGYGGFNISLTPSYLGEAASFIKRGGVYAIACLRGGSEYGENWHLAGMREKKQNVFDDFIAGAEYLIREKYTNSKRLGISGRSNGGLLTGTVMVERPDLMACAVVGVPLLDMIRYHKFLIARYWIPEYGDPDVAEDYEFINKYSPYQNIKEGVNYPVAFVAAGENDSRVDPLHAKKFVAKLQNNKGQKNPAMLFVDFDAGHGAGGTGLSVDKRIEARYVEWKFIMNNLGMVK